MVITLEVLAVPQRIRCQLMIKRHLWVRVNYLWIRDVF